MLKFTFAAFISLTVAGAAAFAELQAAIALEKELTLNEMNSIQGGDPPILNRACGTVTACIDAPLCAKSSPAGCSKKSETIAVPQFNNEACTVSTEGVQCTETTPNGDCAYVYDCKLNNLGNCVQDPVGSIAIRNPTACQSQ